VLSLGHTGVYRDLWTAEVLKMFQKQEPYVQV